MIACLCLAAVLRGLNYRFVFANVTGHLNFIDPDDWYYLRRLVHFLTHFPHVMTFDPSADWPTGSGVDWMEGHLFALGLPLKLFGVHSFRGLEFGASLVMVCIGLLTILSIYFLSRKILKDFNLSLLVMFFASVNFLLVRFSCLGGVDHHIWEAMFPPLILLLALNTFDGKAIRQNFGWGIFLAIVIAFSLTISSSSLFIIGVFYAAYAFWLGERNDWPVYLMMNSLALALIAPYAAWCTRTRGDPGSITHVSYFHILLIALLATAAWLIARYRKRMWTVLPILIALPIPFLIFNWPEIIVAPLKQGFFYSFGKGGVLTNVAEASSIFTNFGELNFDFAHVNFGYLIYLLPIVYLLLPFFKKWSKEENVFFMALALLAIPGVYQKRFAQLMIGCFLVFCVWLFAQLLEFVHRRGLRIRAPLHALLLGLMILPGVRFGFVPTASPRDRVDLNTARIFLQKLNIKPEDVWARLASDKPSDGGIWCNPNEGNMLQYLTGYGTVTNGFYHGNTFDIDYELRNIKEDKDFLAALEKYKIRYIVSADDWRFFELQMRMHGQDTSSFLKTQIINGQSSLIFQMPELEKYAWVRLITHDEHDPKFRMFFSIRFNEYHFYNFLRGFEVSSVSSNFTKAN